MSHEKLDGGPYREAADPNAMALENMRKKIEAEGKHGILIAEDIKQGDEIPKFIELLKKFKLEDTVLYSARTGILRYDHESYNHSERSKTYTYLNEDSKTDLIILCKKKTAKILFKDIRKNNTIKYL